MNDITDQNADRFYKPKCLDERLPIAEEIDSVLPLPRAGRVDRPPTWKGLEFAPEVTHMNEAKAKGLKFTVGNKYPIVERQEWFNGHTASYTFKTTNDEGKEVWVDEKYFIPTETPLVGEFISEDDKWMLGDTDYQPDIRTMAKEKNIPEWTAMGWEANSLSEEELFVARTAAMSELQTLSGLADSDCNDTHEANCHKKYRNNWRVGNLHEGTVIDTGNDLLENADKCMAAIDRVFGYNKVVDPDSIIVAIQKYCPKLSIQWEDHCLSVNGAKTKINYKEVQDAYSGLKGLVSTKIAEKTVGKLVATKLKKLF